MQSSLPFPFIEFQPSMKPLSLSSEQSSYMSASNGSCLLSSSPRL
jgi:hypothetical protein